MLTQRSEPRSHEILATDGTKCKLDLPMICAHSEQNGHGGMLRGIHITVLIVMGATSCFASRLPAAEPVTSGCCLGDGFEKHSGCGSAVWKLCFYLHAPDSSVWEHLCVLPATLVPGSCFVFPPMVCRLQPSCFSCVMKEIKIKWAGP